ncbi:aha1 domain-containing protein [Artemisia annua]|uniref:Aha1 domain-containing protein n=1 Tax=Artemisia annua TaxID=35608 RepID=A0A2U1K941_ARTAN|nr:aha1 domain-containing protein [Artemisia annua]
MMFVKGNLIFKKMFVNIAEVFIRQIHYITNTGKVRLVLEEPEPGVTVVNLTQTDVPEEDRYGNSTVVENTERGWRDLIFHKIRAVFGFGV